MEIKFANNMDLTKTLLWRLILNYSSIYLNLVLSQNAQFSHRARVVLWPFLVVIIYSQTFFVSKQLLGPTTKTEQVEFFNTVAHSSGFHPTEDLSEWAELDLQTILGYEVCSCGIFVPLFFLTFLTGQL